MLETTPRRAAFSLPVAGTLAENLEIAVAAEQAGYDDVWLADTGGWDPFLLASLIGERTRQLRIGTAIIGVFSRTAPAIAASVATLADQIGPGRVVLGLGSSSPAMVEGFAGLAFRRPLSRVRDTAAIVRQALSGQKTDYDGAAISSHGYRLPAGLQHDIPVWTAVQRPASARLAAEIADGVITAQAPLRAIPMLLREVAAARQELGRTGPVGVVARIQVHVTTDVAGAVAQAKARLAPYLATPVYNPFIEYCGFAGEAAGIRAGWAARDRDRTTAAVSGELAREIVVIGDAGYCRERLAQYAAAGVSIPMVNPVAADAATALATLQALAPGA
jgi:alkanesulfonate monooxygenase SsuD/methylene tetrahydromethanopterin reductase-like flavin-dependent oxidoreductase (luciferase family)